MPQPPARQPFKVDRSGGPRIMRTGPRPALAALPRTLPMPSINDVQSSPVPELILVIQVDSTVELPSKPDSGSADSSSCVRIASRHCGASTGLVALLEISNFAAGSSCVRPILGPCRGPLCVRGMWIRARIAKRRSALSRGSGFEREPGPRKQRVCKNRP